MIYRVNLVLAHRDIVSDLSQEEHDRMTGECLLLRGIGHFELVRMFGQAYAPNQTNDQLGVPVRLAANADPLDRSSVEDVYAQVIADMEQAVELLPEDNGACLLYTSDAADDP